MKRPEGSTGPVEHQRGRYIVGPLYDWLLFLFPPLGALLLGALIAHTRFSDEHFWIGEHRTTRAGLLLGTLVNAHLVAVFFRSHLNPAIFRRYRLRFLLVPPLLFVAMQRSLWVLVSVTVLVVFWDVYHSGLQTFGLARMYDRNRGNDPKVGRRLDLVLNHVLYAGPIVAGATMLDHFGKFELFEEVDASFLVQIPAFMRQNQRYFTWSLLGSGTLFLFYYVIAYARLAQKGYKISFQKVFLLATTGACSICSWGFNTLGDAFFIMNVFHAVQYLGLVWWAEGKTVQKHLRLERARVGKIVTAFVFFGLVFAYGYWAELQEGDVLSFWCITQIVAVMHFWYDGFVWSVTRKQI